MKDVEHHTTELMDLEGVFQDVVEMYYKGANRYKKDKMYLKREKLKIH